MRVGSSTSAFVSSVAERRSSTTTGKPRLERAARVFDDANDDCEKMDAQLLPGVLVWVLGDAVDASSDVLRLVTAARRDWSSTRSSSY